MPGFDGEIAKMAQRVLVNPRRIDWHTGVLATKVTPGRPKRGWCQRCWCSSTSSELLPAVVSFVIQQLGFSTFKTVAILQS